MTRKTRKTLFYVLVALFFLIGILVILYAQGWRLDLFAWRIDKVGAIYLRSFPGDAQISIDGKPAPNQSGLLSAGTFLSGLFPRTYSVALTKSGYDDWHEDAAVLPSLVTEFKYAVLVPKAPAAISTDTVANFSVVSGETIEETENGAIRWRGKTIGHGIIVSESADLKNIVMKNPVTGAYLLYDFGENSSTNLSAFLPGTISSVSIDPYDATQIIAATNRRVMIFDAAASSLSTIGSAPAGMEIAPAAPAATPSLIAWTQFKNDSGASAIVLYDEFAKTISQSSTTIPGRTLSLKWLANDRLVALQNDGSLYIYNPSLQEFQKLADDVKDFEPTDDGSAVAALENMSLEVFSFSDTQSYRRFNLPDVGNARSVLWYGDMDHLFVVYPDHVSFLDLDDLGLKNFITVADGTDALYNPQQNIFYLVNSAQKIAQFDFPS